MGLEWGSRPLDLPVYAVTDSAMNLAAGRSMEEVCGYLGSKDT
jgi:hypothetical protein